jgi:hypothetical protein
METEEMTQIKQGLIKSQAYTHVVMTTDDSIQSTDKKPSVELISLLNVAASGMLAFGELWDTVKTKGAEEGFDEKALLTLFAPMVKDKFTAAQVRYLMNKEKEQERARDNRAKQKEEIKTLRTYAHIPPKKELEQSDIEKIGEIRRAEEKMEAESEEPSELELAEIKIKHLEEALKKTEQFKPATQLQPQEIDIVNTVVVRAGLEKIETAVHNEIPSMRNRGWKTVEITMRTV